MTKKAITPKKTPIKSVSKAAAKPRAKAAAATKTRAVSKTRSAAKKKPVAAKKGLLHHVKRIHRMTPKFVHGMLVGGVVGLALVSYIGSTGHASANPDPAACIKTPGGINVNNANANVDIRLDAGCGGRYFVMKAWYADSKSGEPHDTQRLWAQSAKSDIVKPSDNKATHMNVTGHDGYTNVDVLASGCFYQIDLVDVTNPPVNGKYPIPAHVTGGSRNCNPTPAYACSTLHAAVGANRLVTIDQFSYTASNAVFTKAKIAWGDGSDVITANVQGSQHTYAKDGSYTIAVVAYFKIRAQDGDIVEKAAAGCTFAVPPLTTTTPGTQSVCELKTTKIVTIPEGPYDTTVYGPTNAKECNPVTPPSTPPSTPGTPTTPTSTLVKTGPGALIVVFFLAVAGGFIFHHGHRHITSKKKHA